MISERKILIVDDEPTVLEMLELAFDRAGYSVRLASGAEGALDILNQESIPLMFIDLGLEKMNGFELCEMIRKDNPDAIIFALTGYAALFGQHEILEAGFDDYLAKPINIETLYQIAGDSYNKIEAKIHDQNHNVTRHILIIDDDSQFRRMLRHVLEHEGFKITEAQNGEEGIKAFSENPTDLVISDIIMPQKEGIETILEIKEKHPDVKFIAVSGAGWYASEVDFDMARALGAKTLKKPFQRKDILEMIKQLQV